MSLRTPRRRISPRTIRRYRAIKDFFKKALGSASQPDIRINSSITDNVSDLKHKIIGLEQQLSEVSKHCRDIIRLESTSQQESRTFVSSEAHGSGGASASSGGASSGGVGGSVNHGSRPKDARQVDTELLYKSSETQYRHSEGSDCILQPASLPDDGPNISRNLTRPINDCHTKTKPKKKKSKFKNRINDFNVNSSYSKNKTQHIPPYSTSSFHSLSEVNERHPMPVDDCFDKEKHAKLQRHLRNQKHDNLYNEHSQRNYETFERYYEEIQKKQNSNKKKKHSKELDQDFIADIIKRQYKPIKLFGRDSALSQVSEPVCRDQEFRLNENIKEDEWCSCCNHDRGVGVRQAAHRPRHADLDARSICDTRLYSTTHSHPRPKHNRHIRQYNDTKFYDIIPVKEYSSPKTKRKILQENFPYNYYKEVPPSPRSHRPRLNLKAQYYTSSEDHIDFMRNPRNVSPKRHKKYQKVLEAYDTDDMDRLQKKHDRCIKQHLQQIEKNQQIQEDNTTMTSLQYNALVNDPNNIADTLLNKTQETEISEDKTDRALCEIKDILQNFLQEIKKEASSQSGKSDISTKVTDPGINNLTPNTNTSSGLTPNSGHSNSFNYNIPQCAPYIPPFPNPCCYPMLPVCPVNPCMQNGYVVPSPSFTCGNCSKKPDDTNNKSTSSNESNETDELIKEIYKVVAQSPTFSRKQEDPRDDKTTSTEPGFSSRSIGGSAQVCRHDANVGTSKIKSYSKSCEAIGSRMIPDYSGTNASYSETILENVSLEATATSKSITEFEFSRDPTGKHKTKKNKFANMLRSLGIFKKRKDAIEELNESDSSVEVELERHIRGMRGDHTLPPSRPLSPYHQQMMNYAMYEQQHYRPPPIPAHLRPDYGQERAPPFNPVVNTFHMPYPGDPYLHPGMSGPASPRYYPGQPTAPPGPYANYDYNQPTQAQPRPQSPMCLKELELKTTATQSEKKLGFFRKIKKKVQKQAPEQFDEQGQRSSSTQTAPPPKPILNWKTFKAKDGTPKFEDAVAYSGKAERRFVQSDLRLRDTMLKKMFYKRNPFSPRNLLLKTLLSKNKSSFDAPIYKARMFM